MIKWIKDVASSIFFNNDTNGFDSDNVQDAIEEARNLAQGFPRAGVPLINNGTQGDGDWISYSNLTPDVEIIFPVNTRINEVTIANDRDDVEFNLEVYKNGTAPGDLVDTWSFNTGPGVRSAFLDNINLDFVAGDWVRIKYIDQGDKTSDLVVLLWISRIP